MTPILKDLKRKITKSGELTAREKMTVLTLIERWGHPAKWELMSEGYITCSHCHEDPEIWIRDSLRPLPYCPNCGAMMQQPDWLKGETNGYGF